MVRHKWTRTWCCVFLFIIGFEAPVQAAAANTVQRVQSNQVQVTAKSKTRPNARPSIQKGPTAKPVQPKASTPIISADAAVVMDVGTGELLFEKQGFKRRPPASTTKIMTAILGLEMGRPDEIVTVSPKAAAVGESTLHLDPGEKITLYELITGALLRSGNDACVAIAEQIAGTEERFVQIMNKKAAALGAFNTHFANTNGLPNKNHYSTAYDLALMARYGLQLPAFASITRQKETEIHFLEPDVLMNVRNTNKLLWSYPYADGVKTGTTNAAGKCLVASATKEGRQLVAVVLHAPNRFGDAQKLLEWGFQQTETVEIAQAGQVMGKFPVSKAQAVNVFIGNPVVITVPKAEKSKIKTKVIWEKEAGSSFKAGERIGRLEVWLADKKLKTESLLSEKEFKPASPGHFLWPLPFFKRK